MFFSPKRDISGSKKLDKVEVSLHRIGCVMYLFINLSIANVESIYIYLPTADMSGLCTEAAATSAPYPPSPWYRGSTTTMVSTVWYYLAQISTLSTVSTVSTYPPARADDPIVLALFEDPSEKITQFKVKLRLKPSSQACLQIMYLLFN